MSIKLMSVVWEKQVAGNAQMVLLCLADYANDGGICWPSVSEIAWKVGCSERTVIRCINQFRDLGVIETSRRFHNSSLYRLHLDRLDPKKPMATPPNNHTCQSVTSESDRIRVKVTTGQSQSDNRRSESDTAMSLKPPVSNHQLEPSPRKGSEAQAPAASEAKPRTPAQLQNDARYERRQDLFVAYCEGVGIPPDGATATAMKKRAHRELVVMEDADEWTPERFARLAAYALTEFAWKGPAHKPPIIEVIKLADGWVELGEPTSSALTIGKQPHRTGSSGKSVVQEYLEELEREQAADHDVAGSHRD